ncbi:origin recognition complex subunit 1 [Colletotrichum incanum]|uniref:Origin recognition complex subunit 1 n=1 Tax=Colletotrichum incanum TaxID=1573173 RepID=A0A167B7D5_COLIC|nr:origin recognition complex subunit 1 [Colletotrichum incanum]OHW98744.1 ATPase [Colletotrichum incanum]
MNRTQLAGRQGRRQSARSTGVARDDSDDELGVDDLPWEWIYDSTDIGTQEQAGNGGLKSRKRRRTSAEAHIKGARMGNFQCHIGDCVLLKAEGSKEAWVAIICEFLEEEDGEKAASFMWFSTEKEIRNKERKRLDFLPNELYISPSWDVNPLAAINGKAVVLSNQEFFSKYPSGKVPRSSSDYEKTFVCRRACNTRTATYTDEFVWENIYDASDQGVYELIEFVKSHTKSSRRRQAIRDSTPEQSYTASDGALGAVTPKRTAKSEASTPRGGNRTVTTPLSRKRYVQLIVYFADYDFPWLALIVSPSRIMIKKTLEFTPLGTRKLSPTRLQSSPFQVARSQLHVASVPTSLPCRESEFSLVYSHLEAAIADGMGSCIYIAGTPGTGKTATVREVIFRLEDCVRADELDDFIFVEINGMKITDPHQSYSLLWEALKGERVSPTQAIDLLEREFNNPSPRRTPCVVLMDELDQLVTKNQSVMYNFFNWPGLRHSRLIVLAVANTMDLPERTLSNKISSRIGLTRITFPGYNHEQLMRIIQSRLEGVPGNVVEPDAIQFASRKVAAVSGDARRALDICRRAVELAEADSRGDSSATGQKGRRSNASNGKALGLPVMVTIATIKRAINEATTNPIQQYLRSLAFGPKLLLSSLLVKIQRNGTIETTFGDVMDELYRIMKLDTGALDSGVVSALATGGDAGLGKESTRVAEALALRRAAIELVGAGIIVLEAHKAERPSKMRLAVGDEEIKMAFRDDGEVKALGLFF